MGPQFYSHKKLDYTNHLNELLLQGGDSSPGPLDRSPDLKIPWFWCCDTLGREPDQPCCTQTSDLQYEIKKMCVV